MTSGGENVPTEAIKHPVIGGNNDLDDNIILGEGHCWSNF